MLSDARATRLGFDLGGLVTARHARHQALHGRFAEADASWDEAAGSACLAARWSDAATWTFSRRAFSARWNPLGSDDLLPVQTALAARGPARTVLPRDDDALENAFSRLSEDRLRPAAIAAQRALRDSMTGSDWEGERRARRLLADILRLSGEPELAAGHLARAGEVKAVERLGLAHPTRYLDVSDLLAETSYWVAGTAYRLVATQADLVPDAAVDAIADSALEVLDAARNGSLIDLVGWAGSRYLGAIAALAGIASRVSPDRAERCLAYFEGQPAVEPGHYRFHDDDEAAAVAGIADACPALRGRALPHLVALLARSQTSRSAESVRPVENHFQDAQGLLTALAAGGNTWAQEFLASREADGVPGETAEAALARLTTPLVHTPGVYGFGGGGSAITDSVLVGGLPSARLEDALGSRCGASTTGWCRAGTVPPTSSPPRTWRSPSTRRPVPSMSLRPCAWSWPPPRRRQTRSEGRSATRSARYGYRAPGTAVPRRCTWRRLSPSRRRTRRRCVRPHSA